MYQTNERIGFPYIIETWWNIMTEISKILILYSKMLFSGNSLLQMVKVKLKSADTEPPSITKRRKQRNKENEQGSTKKDLEQIPRSYRWKGERTLPGKVMLGHPWLMSKVQRIGRKVKFGSKGFLTREIERAPLGMGKQPSHVARKKNGGGNGMSRTGSRKRECPAKRRDESKRTKWGREQKRTDERNNSTSTGQSKSDMHHTVHPAKQCQWSRATA